LATLNYITPKLAACHEALHLRLATMLRQTEAGASKRAASPVDAVMRRLAEELLFEAGRFTGRPRVIPPAAPDLAGLATQLGQALAALDAFEAARSSWDPELAAFVWAVRGETALPIARLRPKANAPANRDMVEIVAIQRRQLLAMHRRFDEQSADNAPPVAAPMRW